LRPEPVTSATFPSSLPMILSLAGVRGKSVPARGGDRKPGPGMTARRGLTSGGSGPRNVR
jgi:hypothetical protein